MIDVGELIDILEKIQSEYGSDAPVCIQLYDYNTKKLICGDHLLGVHIRKDGTTVLSNRKREEHA